MSKSVIPAGTYELIEFKISPVLPESESSGNPNDASIVERTVDLKNIIHTWSITESMTKGHITGTAKVYDSEGIFYNYPLRGQEKITVKYKDYLEEVRTEELFLFSITDIQAPKKNDDSMLSYNIHFVSWGKFWSERYSISRCIAEGTKSNRKYIPVSEQVKILFEDYYIDNEKGTTKEIDVHDTESEQQIVIPNMRPESAMHLMSRRAYSVNYPSSYYRFFETRDKYRFVNLEEVNTSTPIKKYTYVSGPTDQTPQAELDRMDRIIDISFHSPFDTMSALKEGAYYRKVNEIDVTNRRVNSYEYKHHEEFEEYAYPGEGSKNKPKPRLVNTNNFIDEHLNNWSEVYVVKDYPDEDMSNAPGLRTKPYYGQLYNNKKAHYYDYKATRMTVKAYGSNKLFVGDLIDIDIPYFSVGANKDVERSGTYMIESINNVFYENTYIQEMVVSKGPIGDV